MTGGITEWLHPVSTSEGTRAAANDAAKALSKPQLHHSLHLQTQPIKGDHEIKPREPRFCLATCNRFSNTTVIRSVKNSIVRLKWILPIKHLTLLLSDLASDHCPFTTAAHELPNRISSKMYPTESAPETRNVSNTLSLISGGETQFHSVGSERSTNSSSA